MTRGSSITHVQRLTGSVIAASVLAIAVFGCGEQAATVSGPDAKAREEASTKNMENFMKNAPKPKPGAPKVQTK
jgi:hypothetical protein